MLDEIILDDALDLLGVLGEIVLDDRLDLGALRLRMGGIVPHQKCECSDGGRGGDETDRQGHHNILPRHNWIGMSCFVNDYRISTDRGAA
jgi:hypothetical protein